MESGARDPAPRACRQDRDASLAGTLLEARITVGKGCRIEGIVDLLRGRRLMRRSLESLPKELSTHRLGDEVPRIDCKRGIESLIRHYVPEVETVEAV